MTRIALVLGAGGASGGVYLRAAMGALSEATGWSPAMSSLIVGTSAGALNAARIEPAPIDAPANLVSELASIASRSGLPERGLVDRLGDGPRRIGGRLLGRFVPAGKNSPDYDVAESPYHSAVRVVSCRRSDGARRIAVLSRSADPQQELYASAAVPGFARPVVLDGVEHVDGAVWSTTNADLVEVDSCDAIVVIAPMVPRTGGSLVRRGHRASLLTELHGWRRSGKPVVTVLPSAEAIEQRDDLEAYADDARRQILG